MKLRFATSLVAALVMSAPAHAEEHATSTAFAQIRAILDLCSRVDPADAALYQRLLRQLSGPESSREAGERGERLRNAAGAREETFEETLEKIPRDVAIKACKESIASSN